MIERQDRDEFVEQLLERRRRGRPRTAGPRQWVSVSLPTEVHDALCRQAIRERISLHALMLRKLDAAREPRV